MGRGLIGLGMVLIAAGLLLQYAPHAFSWFGRLPGDIRIETERARIFVPVASMVVLSLLLTLLVNLVMLWRRP